MLRERRSLRRAIRRCADKAPHQEARTPDHRSQRLGPLRARRR